MMDESKIVFDGEVQLLRWSETSNQGAVVTFQLADAADLERFKTMTLAKGKQAGQRLAVVMVEIGDDESPVVQPVAPVAVDQKKKVGELCIMACTFCKDPKFWEWNDIDTSPYESEALAKKIILVFCEIESRKELDECAKAAKYFHNYIRIPFMEWRENNGREKYNERGHLCEGRSNMAKPT